MRKFITVCGTVGRNQTGSPRVAISAPRWPGPDDGPRKAARCGHARAADDRDLRRDQVGARDEVVHVVPREGSLNRPNTTVAQKQGGADACRAGEKRPAPEAPRLS